MKGFDIQMVVSTAKALVKTIMDRSITRIMAVLIVWGERGEREEKGKERHE